MLFPFLFASRAAAGEAAIAEFHSFCRGVLGRALAAPPPADEDASARAQLWRMARGRGGGGGGGEGALSEAQLAAEVATLIVGG